MKPREKLYLDRIGVDVWHNPCFLIDRPRGSGDCLFLHFTSPVQLRWEGRVRREKSGACIFYLPKEHQWYRGDDAGFSHNWFHVSTKGLRPFLRSLTLPMNQVFYPHDCGWIAPHLSGIQQEAMRREPHWETMVDFNLRRFFILLSRNLVSPLAKKIITPRQIELMERFRTLRSEVHQAIEYPWTVSEMAGRVHLSESRFSVLYRQFFGTSPLEDLLRARLQRASWLLTNRCITVGEAAQQSGFQNVYYFSRIFHRRLGCAPRDYSESHLSKG